VPGALLRPVPAAADPLGPARDTGATGRRQRLAGLRDAAHRLLAPGGTVRGTGASARGMCRRAGADLRRPMVVAAQEGAPAPGRGLWGSRGELRDAGSAARTLCPRDLRSVCARGGRPQLAGAAAASGWGAVGGSRAVAPRGARIHLRCAGGGPIAAHLCEREVRREIGRDTSELQSREKLVCRLLLEKK